MPLAAKFLSRYVVSLNLYTTVEDISAIYKTKHNARCAVSLKKVWPTDSNSGEITYGCLKHDLSSKDTKPFVLGPSKRPNFLSCSMIYLLNPPVMDPDTRKHKFLSHERYIGLAQLTRRYWREPETYLSRVKHVITITTVDLIKKCCPCAILEYILIINKKRKKIWLWSYISNCFFFLK